MAWSLNGTRLPDHRLEAADIAAGLERATGWHLVTDGSAIERTFTFADFSAAFGFMTRVALIAERMDHHPDWSNSWSKVTIKLSTHSAGGLTAADLEFAGAINRILP